MVLFTDLEKDHFSNYHTPRVDKSLSNTLLSPLLDRLAKLVPIDVAPNVLSLSGLICLLQAWYFCYKHGDRFPVQSTVASVVLIIVYYLLDSLAPLHAKRTGNDTSITEFFDHACSSIGVIFLTLVMCQCLGIETASSQWYLVQVTQVRPGEAHVICWGGMRGVAEACVCVCVRVWSGETRDWMKGGRVGVALLRYASSLPLTYDLSRVSILFISIVLILSCVSSSSCTSTSGRLRRARSSTESRALVKQSGRLSR